MAGDALQGFDRGGVRLVTIGTRTVPEGSRRELLGVTTLAVVGHAARVRFVAARALLVSGARQALLARVTRRARAGGDGRLVRQARMAARTSGVTRTPRSERELFLMAAAAHGVLGELELEMVRRVALDAINAGVEPVIGRRRLVTARARTCDQRRRLLARGVRVMTTDAAHRTARAPGRAVHPRMIGVNVPVTRRAGSRGRSAYVVWRMATRAKGVSRHFVLRQHDNGLVTRAAGHDTLRLELVRAVTVDARAMSARE